ncbi:MAG: tyrosine-protein phosphatase [Acidobacteria bacterium]|nr:tyrosine-protein phosphatase [Acidobacteriota bacterium]
MKRSMRFSVNGLIALAFTIFCFAAATAQAQSQREFALDIENFGRINEHYYRGAQPDQEGFAQLKSLGVKTVIDLREDREPEAEGWVSRLGMRYFNIPLSSRRAATDEQTAYFLALVNDPNNWPVYVHCAGGRHRTGEMTAIYRITGDGWTADQAYQEMKQFKWYSWGGRGPLKDYVYDYYNRYASSLIARARAGQPDATHNNDDGHLRINSVRIKRGKKLVIVGDGLSLNAIVKLNGAAVPGSISFDETKRRLEVRYGSESFARLQATPNLIEVTDGNHKAAFTF